MTPEATVVVPAAHDATRLSFTLEALAEQTVDLSRFEVIVVRPSTGGPATAAPAGLALREIETDASGAPAQRNIGWRAAAAPLVAFTSEECRPTPGWLDALLGAPGRADDVFLGGPTDADPDESHLDYGIARTLRLSGDDRSFGACNIAYPTALLARLGGFDEDLPEPAAGADLGLRAEAAGARYSFVSDAVVWSAVNVRSIREALAEAERDHGEQALLERHPAERERLHLGAFVSEEHARAVLGLAGLMLWRRSRTAALVAAYPYLAGLARRRLRNPNPLSPLGLFRLASDVAVEGSLDSLEILARARASISARRVVL